MILESRMVTHSLTLLPLSPKPISIDENGNAEGGEELDGDALTKKFCPEEVVGWEGREGISEEPFRSPGRGEEGWVGFYFPFFFSIGYTGMGKMLVWVI